MDAVVVRLPANARGALIIVFAAFTRARGAVPSEVKIDSSSISALLNGQTICGNAAHADACLSRVPCIDVDESLPCTDDDPIWIPDGATHGDEGRLRANFRAIVPLAESSHPNGRSLGTSRHRLIGTNAFWMLPRASRLYMRAEAASHKADCGRRYCAIPNMLLRAYDDTKATEKDIAFVSAKKKGFDKLYEMATDLPVGFRREDILFAWAQLDKHVVWAPARPMVSLATYQAMVRAVYAAAEPDSEELESPRVALPLEAATRLIQSIGPPQYGVLPSDVQPKQASSKAEALSDAVY